MTARLLMQPVLRATDEDGQPISGALLYAYLSGGTTPTPIYTSFTLTTQHSNPVVADADGWFPPVFISDAISYRFQMRTPGGVLLPGYDVDPYGLPVAVSAEDIRDAIAAALTNGSNITITANDGADTITIAADLDDAKPIEAMIIPITDTTTVVAEGVKKFSFRAPFAMTVLSVRASLDTAQTGSGAGGIVTVDINENGTSIISPKLTIDNGEKSSTGAATPPILTDFFIADDAEVTIDVDLIGDGTAKGLIVTLLYRRT